jgi:hypothetical protein
VRTTLLLIAGTLYTLESRQIGQGHSSANIYNGDAAAHCSQSPIALRCVIGECGRQDMLRNLQFSDQFRCTFVRRKTG